MLWKILLLAVLILGALAIAAREVLVVGEERRRGAQEARVFRRFRRRAKGLLLVVVLGALALFYDEAARLLNLGPRGTILYTGLVLVMLIWLLILAGRDVKEATEELVTDQRTARQQAMADLDAVVQERLAARREKPPKEGR